MSGIFNIPFDKVVKTRTSIRNYSDAKISEEIREKIDAYINVLSGPFPVKVLFKLIESEAAANSAKLGTYGVIKGARNYIGAKVSKEEFSLEELGYEFEKLILYLTSLGLGTCWLGGTFKRDEFGKIMEVKEGDLFPVISPVGYAADKKHLTENIVRFIAKSDKRKPWEELFFNKDFLKPLSKLEAGEYRYLLEMLRLAPSAANKQPWRLVKDGSSYHFYEFKAKGYNDVLGYDIQRVDMGIAMCHFHLAAMEKELSGEFKKLSPNILNVPVDAQYVISWIKE
ncbi:nitroreductase family protein [Clostridium oryzae]|uniref:Nitroreductase family protein n=1 Tax=Clostridium oryzae TaxID=1450648 RepID=A0A1V4II72_9CLOT|nr:nitroreductase family protein [Clostridium oryzae]OPJ59711.1 nitroreductase family protein [Clostridium oryzae]